MSISFENIVSLTFDRTEKLFTHYLIAERMPAPILQESMAYGVLNGGKRIRPLLVYATGQALGASLENLDAPACAVELIHSYSLIHDDLPAMDNSDLRRGKPTCHKIYGDAMAILAGDALQAFVFQILARHPSSLEADQRLAMIDILSEASGPFGMAAGQALDITIMDKTITRDQLIHLYRLKTGALIEASVRLGLAAAPPQNKDTVEALHKFAQCIGLAFQIQDDLMDRESSKEALGKPIGIDVINKKMTFTTIEGVEKSHAAIKELMGEASECATVLGVNGKILVDIANHLVSRQF